MNKSEFLLEEINKFKEESFVELIKSRLNKTLHFYVHSLDTDYNVYFEDINNRDLKKIMRGLSK